MKGGECGGAIVALMAIRLLEFREAAAFPLAIAAGIS